MGARLPKGEKHYGSPFAKPIGKPWHVDPTAPTGFYQFFLWGAMTVTIFFRRDFGEKYLRPGSLYEGMIPLSLCALAARHRLQWSPYDGFAWLIFCLAFLAYVTVQLFVGLNRRSVFPDEYSNSGGRPRDFFFRFMPFLDDEWDFERFYEPGICIAIGSLLIYFHMWFGAYLISAGICAILVAQSKFAALRQVEISKRDENTQKSNLPKDEDRPQQHINPIAANPDATDPRDRS